ncbi:MAG: hypothetical protein V4693_15585 [Pseudomonadota bacterium]
MLTPLAKISARLVMLAAAATLSGLLTGCGGDNDSYEPPPPPPPKPPCGCTVG